jgi:hypothetical protein
MSMDFQRVKSLQSHPAWLLLRADNAPLVVSFLNRVFVEPNTRSMAQPELAARLEDALFQLRREIGEHVFPKRPQAYLDDWAGDACGWLRKYYPPGNDVANYDITPATEKAIRWLATLARREFVGTGSRLVAVFEEMRQLIASAEVDPDKRIGELVRKRAEIDTEIARIRGGDVPVISDTDARERFQHAMATARALLSDFREVEQNFRDLDRNVRERIAVYDGSKNELLVEIFGERDAIVDSDEGRSFRAFWEFLMSTTRQEELTTLLTQALEMDAIKALNPDPRLRRIHFDWLDAGEVAQRMVARLSEQLRRYIDDRAFLENRRIMQILRGVESDALALREAPPAGEVMEIDAAAPALVLPFERPLFAPTERPRVANVPVEDGEIDVPSAALFGQIFVDRARLKSNIRRQLQTRDQISLADLVAADPLQQGLAELVAYMSLAADDANALIDDRQQQQLSWEDSTGERRQATMPLIVFTRTRSHVARLKPTMEG